MSTLEALRIFALSSQHEGVLAIVSDLLKRTFDLIDGRADTRVAPIVPSYECKTVTLDSEDDSGQFVPVTVYGFQRFPFM